MNHRADRQKLLPVLYQTSPRGATRRKEITSASGIVKFPAVRSPPPASAGDLWELICITDGDTANCQFCFLGERWGFFFVSSRTKKGSAEFGDATYKLVKVDFLQIW